MLREDLGREESGKFRGNYVGNWTGSGTSMNGIKNRRNLIQEDGLAKIIATCYY